MDDTVLAHSVEQHFGPVFESPGAAELHLEGWVQPRPGGGFDAHLRVSRGTRELGTRILHGNLEDCSDLTRQLLLVIALVLDPERSWSGQFPSIFAEAPADAGAVLLRDGSLTQPPPETAALAKEAAHAEPAGAASPRGREDDAPTPSEGETRRPGERERPWEIMALMGPGYGGAGDTTFWIEPSLVYRVSARWWVRGAAPVWFPVFPNLDSSDMSIGGFGGRLDVCRSLFLGVRWRIAACAGAGATAVRVTHWDVNTFDNNRWASSVNLSGQVLFERNLLRWGLFAASIGAQGNLTRVSIVEDLPDDERWVNYTQPPVGAWGSFGLGVRF